MGLRERLGLPLPLLVEKWVDTMQGSEVLGLSEINKKQKETE